MSIQEKKITTVDELRAKLLEQEIATENELDTIYRNDLSKSFEDSQTRDGVGVAIDPLVQVGKTSIFVRQPSIDRSTGQQRYRSEREAIEIFKLYKRQTDQNIEREKEAYEKLIRDAKMDWWRYEQHVPVNERDSISLGRKIDKSYFLENLYRCPYDMTKRCIIRYKSPADYKPHFHA